MISYKFGKLLFGMLILVTIQKLSAQEINGSNSGKKSPGIGFSYNLVDFDTKTLFPKEDSVYGFSFMYWKGISKKIDFSFRLNGIFSNKNVEDVISANRMSSEVETAVHAKAFPDEKVINPFLSAGLGIGNYKKSNWEPYAPIGVGLQANMKSELYFILQANYRYSFNENDLPHNMFYSLGFVRSLHAKKKPAEPVIADKDGDGVPDNIDACPDVAGLASLQGCPDMDNDGIADKDDACPAIAGLKSLNGCPDKDADGIADKVDKCPDVAGFAKYNGCPIPDSDLDGINDEEDQCPTLHGLPKYNGCPAPDTDGDGVNDDKDKCPSIKGLPENDGCPAITEEVKTKVTKAANSILFVSGSANLQKNSLKGLNELIAVLIANPEMKLTIEGHTDNTGSDELNQQLSENRAAAVKDYLISKGVDASRIQSIGYGETKPIANNETKEGRQKNRRSELIVSYYQ